MNLKEILKILCYVMYVLLVISLIGVVLALLGLLALLALFISKPLFAIFMFLIFALTIGIGLISSYFYYLAARDGLAYVRGEKGIDILMKRATVLIVLAVIGTVLSLFNKVSVVFSLIGLLIPGAYYYIASQLRAGKETL